MQKLFQFCKNRLPIRPLFWLFTATLFLVILPSFKSVRGLLTSPLYVSIDSPTASTAYVMADGHAYWGRLNGAADLYHMHDVDRILISHEESLSQFNFVKGRNDQLFERAIDHLVSRGVPGELIETVPVDGSHWMSSLSEAKQVAKLHPNLESLVIVTSAPHTRRSLLCFQRSLPAACRVEIHSPSKPSEGWDIHEPLWIEYAKLMIYSAAAW